MFSEWEKSAIPVVQENYMIRNTMLAQCYKDMEQFKHKYSIAEEEVANEFNSFIQKAEARVNTIGLDILSKY